MKNELESYFCIIKEDKLFTAMNGEYMTKSSFRKFWESILKTLEAAAYNIRKSDYKYINEEISFTPHICRHNYATDLYYSGVDVKAAQYLLGHSTINITLDIYTHLDQSRISIAAEKLNEYLSQSKISQMDFSLV